MQTHPNNTQPPFAIDSKLASAIDLWLAKYPSDQRRSAVVPALLLIQQHNHGWLSQAAMQACADYLQIPPIAVYEVATFYDMFELKPIGRHKINICTNVSCMLRGADTVCERIKEHLGIEFGETTPDGLFSLRESECLASCGTAPMCQIDDKAYHENLEAETLVELVEQLKAQAQGQGESTDGN